MRTAEGREEVIKRVTVGQVNDRELRAPAVFVAPEQVIFPYGQVEQVTGSDARRVVIVILLSLLNISEPTRPS